MVWEQVLDVSQKANIQHAATKITNMEDGILWIRLFCLQKIRTKHSFHYTVTVIRTKYNFYFADCVIIKYAF